MTDYSLEKRWAKPMGSPQDSDCRSTRGSVRVRASRMGSLTATVTDWASPLASAVRPVPL